ncbi:MAG: hypothetical protein LBF82_00130 [Lactobacillales bacterium]|jgi:hypothetical protein|nr:hypothetical protein [Lactobacillales bacterium]
MNKKFKKLVFGLALLAPLACAVPAKAQQFTGAAPGSPEQLPLTWWDSTSRFDFQTTTDRKNAVVQGILSLQNRYNIFDILLSAQDLYVNRDSYRSLDIAELPEVKTKFGALQERRALTELNIMADFVRSSMVDVYDELRAICSHESKYSLADLETKTTTLTITLNKAEETNRNFHLIIDGLNNKKFSKLILLETNYFTRHNVATNDILFTTFVDE